MRKISLIAIGLLTACATEQAQQTQQPVRFTHKTATLDQLFKDRYECLKETEQRQTQSAASGYADGYGANYGGSSKSTVKPTCSALGACLAARGYIKAPNGNLEVPASAIIHCSD